ncbi:lysosomal alpha-mannosidase-like isoform X1 [Pectinophora gossypiella]|nr:lysosomal alpha-mannosidase-like isoform X1 [Pectinophora gossypiella]XP_049884047.1 lysosomal alpha-mannosidase-like isoform X1 [Pectinophora gossypiella]
MLIPILLLVAGLVSGSPVLDLITPRHGETCGYESCTQAEDGVLNVHIVPHTHDDVGWLKTVDQYYYGSANSIQVAGVQYILDTVVKELWANPKRRFIYVETFFFWKWWVRQSDDVRHKVHVLVRQGRLQFVGGAWSMNDEAAAHYHSTVDQFTWGLSKLNQTFGPCGMPRVGWQIDPFGHAREFASLLAGMGYDGLFLGRIDYQDKMHRKREKHMEMLWRGDDDLGKSSDLFTGVLYNTYSPPPGFCFDILCRDEPIVDDPDSPMFNVDERVTSFLAYVKEQARNYRSNSIVLTMGGDFTYQDAGMYFKNLDMLIEYVNLKAAKDGLNVKLFYSTPDCYLKAVNDANPILPVKQDDFFPYASDSNAYWTGYFTSRPTTKYFEREGNSYLQMVKQLQVLAGLEDHNMFVLNELKGAMGIMQHHDAITGTEKQHVTHDYVRLLDAAIEDAITIARQAFNKMIQGDALKPPILSYDRCRLNESSCHTSEQSQQFVVTVYNHLAWQVNEPIRIPVLDGNYAVYAPNGDLIVSQLVDIPEAVKRLPSRKSSATHEIVFIAHLHPLSYKNFYVTKKHKITKRNIDLSENKKRKNEFYNDINDYWKKMNEKSFIDLKAIEDNIGSFNNVYKDDVKVPEEPIFIKNGGDSGRDFKDFNIDVMKDSKSSYNPDTEQLEEIIKEARRLIEDAKHTSARGRAAVFPKLNDDEMRMLADDPGVVDHFPETLFVQNKHMKLEVNGTSGQIILISQPDGTDIKYNIKFYYYPACVGDNWIAERRSSGAYIFRPNGTNPTEVPTSYVKGASGPVVDELRSDNNDSVANTVRVYKDLNFIENDWVVGPIDISDDVGKEFIVRYITDIVNNGEFYTDSNGRQMLKRKLFQRPQWNVSLAEPVSGNYYPVVNKITIEDDKAKIAVLTDRSEGGSALTEGQVELMLHRRLLHDDAFGVGEALNETEYGKGMVVRGRHRIFLSKPDSKSSHIEEKKLVLQFDLQPQVFISDAKDLSLNDWKKLKNSFAWANGLQEGLHLLTLEPWFGSTLLLRLENYLEIADREDTSIKIDLQSIFKCIKVKSYRETTLAANHWISDVKKWNWRTKDGFAKSFNEAYGNANVTKSRNEIYGNQDDGSKITIRAKQIRTFIVDYELM